MWRVLLPDGTKPVALKDCFNEVSATTGGTKLCDIRVMKSEDVVQKRGVSITLSTETNSHALSL